MSLVVRKDLIKIELAFLKVCLIQFDFQAELFNKLRGSHHRNALEATKTRLLMVRTCPAVISVKTNMMKMIIRE